jgi:hypothetical protein
MFSLRFEFICGFSVGGEFVTHRELGEEGEGWVIIVDFGIFRAIIEKLSRI